MTFCLTETIIDLVMNGGAYKMAKIGRPKKDSPKLKSITIRLSDSEYEKFIKYAASHNMTMTQALTKGIELLYQNP